MPAIQLSSALCSHHLTSSVPQVLCSTAQRTMQTLEAMQGAVRHFAGVDVHAQGSLFTVAAMDGMTLQALQVR